LIFVLTIRSTKLNFFSMSDEQPLVDATSVVTPPIANVVTPPIASAEPALAGSIITPDAANADKEEEVLTSAKEAKSSPVDVQKEKDVQDAKDVKSSDVKPCISCKTWVGPGLPFRPVKREGNNDGEFEFFNSESWPDVDTKEFAHILTAQDVRLKKHELTKRVVCAIPCDIVDSDINGNEEEAAILPPGYDVFYMHHNSNVAWAFHASTGAVYAYRPYEINPTMYCVAKSLPAFWARVAIESDIFWASDLQDKDIEQTLLIISRSEHVWFNELAKLDLARVWQIIVKHFAQAHVDYLRPFYTNFKVPTPAPPTPAVPATSTPLPTMDNKYSVNNDNKKTKEPVPQKKDLTNEQDEDRIFGFQMGPAVVGTLIAAAIIGFIAPWARK